jgi:Fe-S cluster biosynthesis and repair protein YggX
VRGDRLPRDAMAKLLADRGAPVPKAEPAAAAAEGPETGFRCQRPGCPFGRRARLLEAPPIPDELGQRIQREICADCWDSWKKDYSIKVINELRLDLSSELGSEEYDKHMRGYFGFEENPAAH